MDIDAAPGAAPGPYVFTEERARAWTEKGYQRAGLLPTASRLYAPRRLTEASASLR
jgi:hypothetical protein